MKFPVAVLSVIATAPFDEGAVFGNPFPLQTGPLIAASHHREDLYLNLLYRFSSRKRNLIVWYGNIGSYATNEEFGKEKPRKIETACIPARTVNSFRGDCRVR